MGIRSKRGRMTPPIRGCTCTDPDRLGGKHKCTPGRPRCRRADSKRNRTCLCGGYHYPHREGSAQCSANPSHAQRLNALAWGSPPANDSEPDSLAFCPF